MSDAVNGWTATLHGMPEVGQKAEAVKTMQQSDIELFSALTGDRQPLHTNPELAKASRFGGVIVQGGVTSGLLNAVVAEQLPGPGSVFLNVDWNFSKPVYLDDTITATVEILEVRPDKPICVLKTVISNQKGEVCLEGKATTYTAELKGLIP
ncbi:MaoC family dehydratase [Paenalcaligenes niemegkensis]|uniref:MaoC family dehydratase n=1 Tax=Paenalcaligenes niemegkensis TaxID=2895469 RepID=UPI001EE98477|nr:MaoC family dehydratase [Paenalcaligenes niemegkensis]MCQ9618305.1 MaoC family dehydratase [Paenalcaligenes niemegkensis]